MDTIEEFQYWGSNVFDVDPESVWGQAAEIVNTTVYFMAVAAEGIWEGVAAVLGPFGDSAPRR